MSVAAQPAPALIAFNLLAVEKAHDSTRPAPASSGSAALDELALSGGFRYGEITSIAGAIGTGKTLVGLNETPVSESLQPYCRTWRKALLSLTNEKRVFTGFRKRRLLDIH